MLSGGLPVRGRDGVRLLLDCTDYIGRAISFTGSFEPLSVHLARRLMASGEVFLNAIANFGLYTCLIAAIRAVRCIAVDPSLTASARLRRNIGLSAFCLVSAVDPPLPLWPRLAMSSARFARTGSTSYFALMSIFFTLTPREDALHNLSRIIFSGQIS